MNPDARGRDAVFDRETAVGLDSTDPLAPFRDEFVIDDDLVYLDGNSLGRLPKRTVGAVNRVMEDWGSGLVLSWNHWLGFGLELGDRLAPLIGAAPDTVALCDQTSVNLYKLASAAIDGGDRRDIVTDRGNFPSDRYILDTVARAGGGSLRMVSEDPNAAEFAAALDGDVALVALSHVSYRSGAILDMSGITAAVHSAGALVLWDLSHSAGSVPVTLEDARADLAVGCTYKYLNGGPGAPAFLYVRPDHQARLRQPIEGWFAHADQFGFHPDFEPAAGVRRFTVGTPPILSMTAAGEGIALTAEAGIAAIRDKSVALTTAFLTAIGDVAEIASPLEADRRGSHITVRHRDAWKLCQALRDARVIVDFRAPDLIRFGFAPLYTSFEEAWRAAAIFRDILETETFQDYPEDRAPVT